MCVGVRVREPRTDFRLSPFPSPSTSHPIPTSSYLRLRYTCIRRWTLLGQLLDPAWIDCESRPPVSCSCIPFLSRASYALGLDRSVSLGSPSHHAAAYRTGTTSVELTVQSLLRLRSGLSYFVHRFNRAHLFVFSSLSITSTSFSGTTPITSLGNSLDWTTITRPWQVSTSPA